MRSSRWSQVRSRRLWQASIIVTFISAWAVQAENHLDGAVVGGRSIGSEVLEVAVKGAKRLFVDAARGDDSNDGLTLETSLASIQAGIDRAEDGATVLVYPGWYTEDIDFAGKNVVLTGARPMDSQVVRSTVIDGFVFFSGDETPSCRLTGFKINGGIIGSGPWTGLNGKNHTRATLSHCVLESIMTGCGGVIQDCDGTISHCVVADISYKCRKAWPVPAITGCHGVITNCTVVNATDGIEILEGGSCTIENSILWGATPIIVSQAGTVQVSYSNVEGGMDSVFGAGVVHWGPGNIDADPCFADPGDENERADYHLKSQVGRWDVAAQAWVRDTLTSLCVDAGNPANDEMSEVWPHGQRRNMGAYGGTAEASLSLSARGSMLAQEGTDKANAAELFALIDVWLAQGVLRVDDVNQDGRLDFSDFVETAKLWDSAVWPMEEPFEIVLGQGAAWSQEQPGYDSTLPGYHLVGDIASLTLRSRATALSGELVLAIRNWPSEIPMLENFTVTGSHVKLSGEPFKQGRFERYERSIPQARWEFVSLVPAEDYFTFEIVGNEVHVKFLPRALELLSDECVVSWIDWYRR